MDGAANAELIAFLARALGVAKRDISIVRGATGRRKTVTVEGLDRDAVANRLLGGRE